jgi:hypothetical protein
MKDISYIAAFPKSGITFLNYMLFHVLFDAPQSTHLIDSDYIFDLHESLARVPPAGDTPRYVKIHSAFGPGLPLHERAQRAVYLVRDPIDVMMSAWDFKHLLGQDGLLDTSEADRAKKLDAFTQAWLATGGAGFPFAGTWLDNVRSWLDQRALPTLVVRYEKLKAEPRAQLERVLAFLGRSAGAERVAAAVEASKVENMKKQEDSEIANRTSGAFYRPFLAKGYAKGHRFVGRLHQGSSEKILNPAAREQADRVFGPIMAQVRERAER